MIRGPRQRRFCSQRRLLRLGLVLVVVVVSSAGCINGSESGGGDARVTVATRDVTTTLPADPFCAEAVMFNDFIDQNITALLEPETAEGYMQQLIDQLAKLQQLAPPEIVGEVANVAGVYDEFKVALARVDYDVAQVVAPDAFSDGVTNASLAIDEYLIEQCGFDPLSGAAFEGEAPVVLDDDELAEVVNGDPDAELTELLVEQFTEEFGLTATEARCLATDMDRESVTAIASGGEVTQAVVDDFAAAVQGCGISTATLGGR